MTSRRAPTPEHPTMLHRSRTDIGTSYASPIKVTPEVLKIDGDKYIGADSIPIAVATPVIKVDDCRDETVGTMRPGTDKDAFLDQVQRVVGAIDRILDRLSSDSTPAELRKALSQDLDLINHSVSNVSKVLGDVSSNVPIGKHTSNNNNNSFRSTRPLPEQLTEQQILERIEVQRSRRVQNIGKPDIPKSPMSAPAKFPTKNKKKVVTVVYQCSENMCRDEASAVGHEVVLRDTVSPGYKSRVYKERRDVASKSTSATVATTTTAVVDKNPNSEYYLSILSAVKDTFDPFNLCLSCNGELQKLVQQESCTARLDPVNAQSLELVVARGVQNGQLREYLVDFSDFLHQMARDLTGLVYNNGCISMKRMNSLLLCADDSEGFLSAMNHSS